MTLDGPKKSDMVFSDRGIQYIMEKQLYESVKPVSIDYRPSAEGSRFQLNSNLAYLLSGRGGCRRWQRNRKISFNLM